MTNKFSVDN